MIENMHQECLTKGDCTSIEGFTPATRDSNCVFRVPDLQASREEELNELLTALATARERQRLVRARVTIKVDSSGDHSINGVAMRAPSISSDGSRSRRSTSISSRGKSEMRQSANASAARHDGAVHEHPDNGISPILRLERTQSLEPPASASFVGTGPSYYQHDRTRSTLTSTRQDKASRHGNTDVINICGKAGLGKSRLVTSVQSDCRKHGYACTVKFDSASSTPFQPIIGLMSSLFRQIMTIDRAGSDALRKDLHTFVAPFWRPFLAKALSLPEDLFSSSTVGHQHSPTGTGSPSGRRSPPSLASQPKPAEQ